MATSSNSKETPATKNIPYTAHLAPDTVGTVDGDATQTIRLTGVPFETLEAKELNGLSRTWFSGLNNMGAKSTRVALWTHIFRRKLAYDLSSVEYDNYFSTMVNKQWDKRLAEKDFFVNELYVSTVFRPAFTDAERFAQKLSKDVAAKAEMRDFASAQVKKVTDQLMVNLRRYHPVLLSTEEVPDPNGGNEGPLLKSELARFYSRILNGNDGGSFDISTMSIRHVIQRSELTFGGDIIAIDGVGGTRYAGIVSLKSPYGTEKIRVNVLHGLLRLPCEYVLSQSYTFKSTAEAKKELETQLNHIETTSGNERQIKELRDAISAVDNGDYSMGMHEFILCCYGDTVEEVSKNLAQVESVMDAVNLGIYRENRGPLITQYFSMLPANFMMGRKRAMPISTENMVSFFPLHNFTTGNPQGSIWGMPLALFETTSGAPYFVNYHVSKQSLAEQEGKLEFEDDETDSDELDEDEDPEIVAAMERLPVQLKEKKKESGNYLLVGPNGSGKTVVQTLIRAFTRKVNNNGTRPYKSFTWDNDQGQEIAIRALGGEYFTFELGEETGLMPFALPESGASYQFISRLTLWAAGHDQNYRRTASDEMRLFEAIKTVYRLPPEERLFAAIRDTLANDGPTGLRAVLEPWVTGPHAWILNSSTDRFNLDKGNDFGFDMTSFLGHDQARTAILSMLKYRIERAAAGSPHSLDIDEASSALKDEFMRYEIIEVAARRIRKKLGVIGLGLQTAADVADGPLAAILGDQFPTRFVFPNPSANKEKYQRGLNLTDKEFDLVQRGMNDAPGKFLVKKGSESVVVKADLSGMGDVLSVLSGSQDNIPIVRQVIHEMGNEPRIWLPEFFKRRSK